MEEPKYRKFYVDWWKIRKSTIYTLVAVILLGVGLAVGGWWLSKQSWAVGADTAEIPKDAARIISFEGDVRITRAATRETILVTKETFVAAGDTIQTQADGRAVVQMIDGSVYSVRPNSTVVVRDSSSLFGGKNVRVSLDDGQINVRTDQQPENTENVVEVAESENRLLPQTDASFNADAQTNGGEIRISRGGVETTMGGEKTTLTENEFAAVSNGSIAAREKLLEPPKQNSPANSAQIIDSTGRGINVSFSWQDGSAAASSYFLQISKSPYFSGDTVLVDKSGVTEHEYRLTGLVPGTYYWRLKSTARSGQTTNWNDPWKFTVIRGDGGQLIDAGEWHVDTIGGNVYLISGRTRPGAVVRSQGREVFAGADGAFRLQVSTASSVASIEIRDDRGNRTGFILNLNSGTVSRRY
jgi:hypothetical protein